MKAFIVILSLMSSSFLMANSTKKQVVKNNYDLTYQQAYQSGGGNYGYQKGDLSYSKTYAPSKKRSKAQKTVKKK